MTEVVCIVVGKRPSSTSDTCLRRRYYVCLLLYFTDSRYAIAYAREWRRPSYFLDSLLGRRGCRCALLCFIDLRYVLTPLPIDLRLDMNEQSPRCNDCLLTFTLSPDL